MGTNASPNIKVILNGTPAAPSNFQSCVIDRDMFQPDMAAVVLSNQGDIYSETTLGSSFEVQAGDSNTTIFKGEVTGLEPIYKGGEKTRILIRGMNRMHRLLRTRKSRTFTAKTDKAILTQVLSESNSGLKLAWKHPISIEYKHVYQHNQTDLEFIRMRAARIGAHVWCVDQELLVQEPDLQSGSIKDLTVDKSSPTGALLSFAPRMSAAAIVKKVTVKGWNPETKEMLTGEATVASSPLGKETSVKGAATLCGEETFTVDHPIWSNEEATFLAKAHLQDSSLTFLTGEAEVLGDPVFELGKIVNVIANSPGKATDPFNGNYYLMGVTHRHVASQTKEGGYTTILRFARDAQKNKG